MCKVDSGRLRTECFVIKEDIFMPNQVLGVDIAKRKFDVALYINGKMKHKVFTNDQEGFAGFKHLACETGSWTNPRLP
jgi:hypothetical protein